LNVSAASQAKIMQREVIIRLALVPLFVLVCYFFEWTLLRSGTVGVLMQLSSALGLPMRALGPNMIEMGELQVSFVIACTMVDAFFGAIPLLWVRSLSVVHNVARLLGVFAGVFVLNVFRLELGFVALQRGVPWWLSHECVAGVSYFCIFLLIMRVKAWDNATRSAEGRSGLGGLVLAAE
jgi:hypothetical protein